MTRYRKICSTEEETNRNLRELKDTFINLNYPKILIDKQISSANKPTRQDLLSYRDKPKNDRTPLVVTYHPCLRKLRNIVSTLQPILESDAALSSAVGGRPLLAYRQPPNLRHLLVSSKMSPNSRPTPNITVPCEVKRCKLCEHINSSQTIQGPNGNTVMVRGAHTCASSKLIYCITCTTCPDTIYIGQTGNTLRNRLNNHKTDIRKSHETPVAQHFSPRDHSLDNLRVCVLRGGIETRRERELEEQKIIHWLGSWHEGLNVDLGFLSQYRDCLPVLFPSPSPPGS